MSAPRSTKSDNLSLYYLLFFLSGFPALLYQIVWQRALFTLYGVNVESVTMIVTVFMLGLGLGSLAGGRLSTHPKIKPLLAFGFIEFSTGIFGFVSLGISSRRVHHGWTLNLRDGNHCIRLTAHSDDAYGQHPATSG